MDRFFSTSRGPFGDPHIPCLLYHDGLDVHSIPRYSDTHLYIINSMRSLLFFPSFLNLVMDTVAFSRVLDVINRDRLRWDPDNDSPGLHYSHTWCHTKSSRRTFLEDM